MCISQNQPLSRLIESIGVDEAHASCVFQFHFWLFGLIEPLVGKTVNEVSIGLEGHQPIGIQFTSLGLDDQSVVLDAKRCLSADFAEHLVSIWIGFQDFKLLDGGNRIVDGEVVNLDFLTIDHSQRNEATMHQQPCAIALDGHIFQPFQEDCAMLDHILLVVGDMPLECLGMLGAEVVFLLGGEDDFLGDFRRGLLQFCQQRDSGNLW